MSDYFYEQLFEMSEHVRKTAFARPDNKTIPYRLRFAMKLHNAAEAMKALEKTDNNNECGYTEDDVIRAIQRMEGKPGARL